MPFKAAMSDQGGPNYGATEYGVKAALGKVAEALNPWDSIVSSGIQLLTSNPNQMTFTDFDARSRRNFEQGTALSDRASEDIRSQLAAMGAQRYRALEADYDRQLQSARDIGDQAIRDISSSYDAKMGGARQGLVSSGLFNTTVAPGVGALVNRERANAISRARSQQAAMFTGLLGQRASALAGERTALDSALSGILGQDYAIRNMLAQRLATPTQRTEGYGSIL
jgi:hypothetical protein